MAARTRKIRHDEETRAKIQASQLINRLQRYALNQADYEISQGQLKAIEILLRKSMPDLAAIEHSGETTVRSVVSDKLPTEAEWEAQHATQH